MYMRTLSKQTIFLTAILIFGFQITSCVDSVEPAGPGQYVNPEYPSVLTGYASIASSFSGGFAFNGRVYILDSEADILESFSLDDQNLNLNPSPITKDTLALNFNPDSYALDRITGTLYIEDSFGHDIYRIYLPDGPPELIYNSESWITEIFVSNVNNSLVICFLGPEWLVRKIDLDTGQIIGEFETDWPITRAAISQNSDKLLVSNSMKEFLLEIDVASMDLIDTLHITERAGPFLYNSRGNVVLFNQYSIDPAVYLFDGDSGELLDEISSINPYEVCRLIPGTDIVIAPRKSDSRVSILNSENMIFAPSIFCSQYVDLAFSTEDGQTIIALSDTPGRVWVYSHQ